MKKKLLSVGLSLLASAATPAEPDDGVHTIVDDGWATTQGHRFSGRVTEGHRPAANGGGKRSSLYRTTRLLLTGGEPGRVTWSAGTLSWQTRTDARGYWELRASHPLEATALAAGWHDIDSVPPPSSKASLLVHDPRNTQGLISDIDDTILVTQVNSRRRLLRNSLTLPPESRVAVAGMAEAYKRLLQANPNPAATPMFYVSASPRQLTDSVRRFLVHNGFPRGVLQLKEVNSDHADPLTDQKAYKLGRIQSILQAFPGVRFVLMGDDGEKDPEIFDELRRQHPGQVGQIWIRRVNPDPGRPRWPDQRDMSELLTTPP